MFTSCLPLLPASCLPLASMSTADTVDSCCPEVVADLEKDMGVSWRVSICEVD